MLMYLAMAAAVIVLGLIGVIVAKPNTFRIERRAQIAAPPEKVFRLLNDFHLWTSWSPWEKLDADLKRSYSGAALGVGAVYEWEGKKAGSGRMEITRADPGRVLIKLDFVKPMTANNMADFTLTPTAGGTEIVWAMYGPAAFMQKLMSSVFNIDKMVGGQFEEGLTNLKAQAEA